MKCTGDEWDHCRVEKMGCTGCYYDKNTLKEAKAQLLDLKKDRESFIQNDKEHDDIFLKDINAINIILQALDNFQWRNEIYIKFVKSYKETLKNSIPKKKIEYKKKELEELLEDK